MKLTYYLLLLIVFGVAPYLSWSQTVYDLDKYVSQGKSSGSEAALKEVTTIEELASTIEAVLFENGEQRCIACEREVPCLKADADISTFLSLTRSGGGKDSIVELTREVKLIRFSIRSEQDMKLLRSIDFTLLNRLPRLSYVVFYVFPSVYGRSPTDKDRVLLERNLKELMGKGVDIARLKIFYRIPTVG